ncbi:hypothetical protein F4803DRAFT_492041 [Xylaria telfairii]|nr:hypothetical protein F4803DRAFT_492041 [Xylaria telfairii]
MTLILHTAARLLCLNRTTLPPSSCHPHPQVLPLIDLVFVTVIETAGRATKDLVCLHDQVPLFIPQCHDCKIAIHGLHGPDFRSYRLGIPLVILGQSILEAVMSYIQIQTQTDNMSRRKQIGSRSTRGAKSEEQDI